MDTQEILFSLLRVAVCDAEGSEELKKVATCITDSVTDLIVKELEE